MLGRRHFSPSVRLLRLPAARAFLLFIILFCGAVQYGRMYFYRDPLSIFYDPSRAFVRWYSAVREAEANEFVRHASETGLRNETKSGSNPSVCACFMTTKREGPQYISTSIGSVLDGLKPVEREDLHLATFFTNTNPSIHPLWTEPWLRNQIDVAFSYNISRNEMQRLQKLELDGDYAKKGVFDYTYALEHCLRVGSKWTLILEGDIIVADGWLSRTLDGLRRVKTELGLSVDQWLFVRLFNQERSTGWSSRNIGGNNEHWISLAIALVTIPMILVLRRNFGAIKDNVDVWTLGIVFGIAIPTFVVLFFQAGKASMLPPSPGIRVEPFGCCSQALVFPQDQVQGLMDYLRSRESGQVDLLLNDRSRDADLSRIALYPVQVQHIGRRSIRGTSSNEAQSIWSKAFEELDPATLRREHEELFVKVYGI